MKRPYRSNATRDHTPTSRARMITFEGLLQALPHDVSVDFRGRNVRMAKHGLDCPQIRPAFQKMGCKRMAQHVRRQLLGDSRLQAISLQNLPETHSRKRFSPVVQKHKVRGL